MKISVLKIAFIFVFSFSIILASSCKKENDGENAGNANEVEKSLFGKWIMAEQSSPVTITVYDISFIDYVMSEYGIGSEEAQAELDMLIAEVQQSLEGNIVFNDNKSYHLSMPFENEEEDGTWSISSDGKTLNLYFENEESNLYIVSLESHLLVLQLPTNKEDIDLDEDGVNETVLDIYVELKLSKDGGPILP